MKLFDENDKYTPKALEFDKEIRNVVMPFFESAVRQGISVRELLAIAHGAVQECSYDAILDRDNIKRRV